MAMYVEIFRTIVSNRFSEGRLRYDEFLELRRQIVLADYEFRKMDESFNKKKIKHK